MKAILVRVLALTLLCLGSSQQAVAQQLTGYQLERIDVPTTWSGGRARVNNLGIVRTDVTNSTQGLQSSIYDQPGLIGSGLPGETYPIRELADIPLEWTSVLIHNLNDDGLEVVGRVSNDAGIKRAFYINLGAVNPATGKSDFILLPDVGSSLSGARAINNDGDIIVQYQLADETWSVYSTHRDDLESVTPLGYAVANSWPFHMNNRLYDPVSGDLIRNAQLMVELPDGDISIYTLGDPVSQIYNLDQIAGENVQGMDLNDFSDVSGRVNRTMEVPDRGNRTKTINVETAILFEFPFASAPLEVATLDCAWGTNNAGDMVGDSAESGSIRLVRDGVTYDFDDYVEGSVDELQFWFDRTGIFVHDINERGISGFGQAVVTVSKWNQSNGGYAERRLYLLTPTVAVSSPAVNVDPSGSLTTTETGGTTTFDVVLNTEPTADVTIGLSSSNTDEGTIDLASLTFTPANWDTPQTVTITGIDDGVNVDGDQQYWIETAPAFSGDADYNGLDADDVSVTNLDNDSPPGGGSVTESSGNINLDIPDNSPGGVSHTITNVGDYDPLAITVNLDISHERMGDLLMWVTPPGGPAIPVSNGDNDLTGLVTATQGNWTLEVIDTRNKKTGTLNGWSITIDY